mgnify:CR=1 FL=1
MSRIVEPAIVCIFVCVALSISVYLGSCMISNELLFWLGVLGEFYALASLHACECCHEQHAYHEAMCLCDITALNACGWRLGYLDWDNSSNVCFFKPTR